VILARFYWGPLDQEFLVLPTENPWPKFVIPAKHNAILIQHFYLLGGQLDDQPPIWSYLYDGDIESMFATS
jgi:hypothetical protein